MGNNINSKENGLFLDNKKTTESNDNEKEAGGSSDTEDEFNVDVSKEEDSDKDTFLDEDIKDEDSDKSGESSGLECDSSTTLKNFDEDDDDDILSAYDNNIDNNNNVDSNNDWYKNLDSNDVGKNKFNTNVSGNILTPKFDIETIAEVTGAKIASVYLIKSKTEKNKNKKADAFPDDVKEMSYRFSNWNFGKNSSDSSTQDNVLPDILIEPTLCNFTVPCNEEEDVNVQRSENNFEQKPKEQPIKNAYVREVHRAIYGDMPMQLDDESEEYHRAAESYALFGEDFLDFPQDLLGLLTGNKERISLEAKSQNKIPHDWEEESDEPQYIVSLFPPQGYYMPTFQPYALLPLEYIPINEYQQQPQQFEYSNSVNACNWKPSNQTIYSSNNGSTYYRIHNDAHQQTEIPTSLSTSYDMYTNNKITFPPGNSCQVPPGLYAPRMSNASFISNTTFSSFTIPKHDYIQNTQSTFTMSTQHYVNTFFKETQYVTSRPQGYATGVHERLIYTQMLQRDIYHQTQAATVAAIFYPKPIHPDLTIPSMQHDLSCSGGGVGYQNRFPNV